MVTSDGVPAIIAVIEELHPHSLRQRCLMHKTRNILDKVPQTQQPQVKRAVQAIWNAPNRATADLLIQDFITHYGQAPPLVCRTTWKPA